MYKFVNKKLEEFLDKILNENKFYTKEYISIVTDICKLEELGYGFPDIDSAENFDFIVYKGYVYELSNIEELIEKFNPIEEVINLTELSESIKDIKLKYLSYKKAKEIDKIGDILTDISQVNNSPELFSKKVLDESKLKNKSVYLDHNIIVELSENENILENILCFKESIDFFYSPNHLEEVSKRTNIDGINKYIKVLGRLTDNIGIFRSNKETLQLLEEDPIYSYNRIKRIGIDINSSIEENRVLLDKYRSISNPQYDNRKHRNIINKSNEKDVVLLKDKANREKLDIALRGYGMCIGLDELECLNEDLTNNYTELNTHIYAIMNALMAIGYKLDKRKDIKSGAYDIEHLIYASKCNYFITKDEKFYERAKIVYEILNLNVKVIHLKNEDSILTLINNIK